MIAMAVKFQNPRRSEQTNEVVIQEDASSSRSTMTQAMNNTETGNDLITERQQKRQKVLEQFLQQAKRRGDLTVTYENKIKEDFRRKQEAEGWRL